MSEEQDNSKKIPKVQVKRSPLAYLAKHIHFASIDSTNTWAKKNVEKWAEEGVTLITATEQTGGRGRFKREWISPPGFNIYATFCFWLVGQCSDIGRIPQLLAIAGVEVLDRFKLFSEIKWPNDIVIEKKKIGGILCETIQDEGRLGIVCGIGLNVNMPLNILLEIDRPATSMLMEGGGLYDVQKVLGELQDQFFTALNQFFATDFAPFFQFFSERSALKNGEKVRFHDNQKIIEGYFDALNVDGSITLLLENGEKKIFHAGEFVVS